MWREERRAADSSMALNAAGTPEVRRVRAREHVYDRCTAGGKSRRPNFWSSDEAKSSVRPDTATAVAVETIGPLKPTQPPDLRDENRPAPICIPPSQLARFLQNCQTLERAEGAWSELAPPPPPGGLEPRGGPPVTQGRVISGRGCVDGVDTGPPRPEKLFLPDGAEERHG